MSAPDDDAARLMAEMLGGAAPAAPAANKKKKKKGKKKPTAGAAADGDAPAGKKLGAAALAIQAAMERKRAEEEAQRVFEEEEERKEKEREAKHKAMEANADAVREAKAEKRKAKKEALRAAGKPVTKAEKQKAEKRRLQREALIAAGMSVGGVAADDVDDATAALSKAKIKEEQALAAKKKKKEEEEEAKLAAEQKKKAAEEAAAKVAAAKAEAEDAAAAAAAAESSEDGWDMSDDDLDASTMAKLSAMKKEDEEIEVVIDEFEIARQAAIVASAAAKAAAAAAGSEGDDGCKKASVGKKGAKASSKKSKKKKNKKDNKPKWSGGKRVNESDSDSDDNSSDGSNSDDGSSDDDSVYDKKADMKDEAMLRREERLKEALSKRSADDLRSPICVVLGHVDTGKTKLLDKIRHTNVQDGEAGGITQQIGATFFPMENIRTATDKLNKDLGLNYKLPGLLVIDTPGHESFSNLRTRGSSLCDIAILVIDMMHGLEQQTIESIGLLRRRKTPFIVALNKVDRLYGWKACPNMPIREALAQQDDNVIAEYEERTKQVSTELMEQGLNPALYYKNDNYKQFVSLVPTSAHSGEGIPDMLLLLVQLTQQLMTNKLMYHSELQCTVIEVKQIEGIGTTIDVVLVNGTLRENDRIVIAGTNGPIVTTVRALLTPQPLQEMRVKGDYVHHKEIRAAMGVKIVANDLDHAIAGTGLYVVGPDDMEEELMDLVMQDVQDVMGKVETRGVHVQASTLGSLEALMEFLRASSIPVSHVSIGPVHKKDVTRASVMLEHKKEYATILAFDVKVSKEAQDMAESVGVRIFTAEIIYHLFDQFTAYMEEIKEVRRQAAALSAVFPCVLRCIPEFVFMKKNPLVLGVDVVDGIVKVGTPVVVPDKMVEDHDNPGAMIPMAIGRIVSIEKDNKEVQTAKKGSSVCIKIQGGASQSHIQYGRHFDENNLLYSSLSRASIDALKSNFKEDLSTDDWKLVIKLKKVFGIV